MKSVRSVDRGNRGKSTTMKASCTHVSRIVPWVEKFRPNNVADIAYQEEVVSVLKQVLKGADLPNFLFYGPPGTGKTSAAVALCRQLYRTADIYSDRVLEMNASDERGINTVRIKIKEFARLAVGSRLSDGSPIIGLKVIILDEADAMTTAAQAALRRTMETESKTTRFFLICNYISKIIVPLTSRCAKFRFKPLSFESQMERLKFICDSEKLSIPDEAIKELIEFCDGDLRKSITCLQTMSASTTQMNPSSVRQMCGVIPEKILDDFLAACHSTKFDDVWSFVQSIQREGYNVYQLLNQIFERIMECTELADIQKAKVFDVMGVCERRILDGSSGFLQLASFAVVVQGQYKHVICV